MAIAPPLFLFPLGDLTVAIVGYSGDGKAMWILSGCLGHRSTAMCFWSLQELESHTSALHFSVC